MPVKYIVLRKGPNERFSFLHRKSTPQRVLWTNMKMYAKIFDKEKNAYKALNLIKRNKKYNHGVLGITIKDGFGQHSDWDNNIQVDDWLREPGMGKNS